MKKSLLLAACAAAAFTLGSCVTWHTGGRIASQTTVYKGFDTLHPVDGKVYVGNKGQAFYMLAAEVTYNDQPPIIRGKDGRNKAANVTPTGRTAWIKVSPTASYIVQFSEAGQKTGLMDIPTAGCRWTFEKEIAELPKGAELWNTGEVFDEAAAPTLFGRTGRPETSTTAQVLTAPLTYVVDPALTVASSSVATAGGLGIGCAALAVNLTLSAGEAVLSLSSNVISFVLMQRRVEVIIEPKPSAYPSDINFIRAVPRGRTYVYEYRQADVNGDGGALISPHLPAPYLRKIVDGQEPLYLFIAYEPTRHGNMLTDEEVMAIRARALQPLLEQGINIRSLNLRPVDNSYDICAPAPSPKEKRDKRAETSF